MAIVQVKDLIEAGVHFGHRASRWNPKMRPYIYGKRNLIHIIDLRETVRGLLLGTPIGDNQLRHGGGSGPAGHDPVYMTTAAVSHEHKLTRSTQRRRRCLSLNPWRGSVLIF